MIEKISKLQEIKERSTLLGQSKKGSLFNSWRAKLYTKKGRDAGFPDSWKTFEGFKADIPDGFREGLILMRKDSTIPFSKENCIWVEKSQQTLTKLTKLAYNEEVKTLLEWCDQFDLKYSGVRQRYFKGKNYIAEQILFGKEYKPKRDITDISELGIQQQRNKISKMLSAYRHDDKVKNLTFNLDREFLEELVLLPCYYCQDTRNVGADRIDNSKGHVKDNIIPCCYTCNVVRNNLFTVEEMKVIGQAIKAIKQNRRNGN